MDAPVTHPGVYGAIAAVMRDIATAGISKSRKNQQQGYAFRGIDDVYNALAPVLARHRLCMLPRVLSRTCTERQTKSGSALFYVVVEVEFDLVFADDGTVHTIRAFGEAMDSADKATNKAMSAAYKYAAMQAFCIPTEGDNDADAHTPPEVVSQQRRDAIIAQINAVTDDAALRKVFRSLGEDERAAMMDEFTRRAAELREEVPA